jgi:hypothetical protein
MIKGVTYSELDNLCTSPSIDNVYTRAVESESEGILGGVGVRVEVGKNVATPTPTSV